jgi:hypothetical protein
MSSRKYQSLEMEKNVIKAYTKTEQQDNELNEILRCGGNRKSLDYFFFSTKAERMQNYFHSHPLNQVEEKFDLFYTLSYLCSSSKSDAV